MLRSRSFGYEHMGPRGLDFLEFLLEGLGSNLWGFRCPVYCQQPDFALLILVFLLGGLLGAAATLWILSRLHPFQETQPRPRGPSTTASSRRLSLYEQ